MTGDFATLAKMRKRLADTAGAPERAALAVAPILEEATRQTFADEKNPAGKAWKADKPKTYALGTRSILQRSGELFSTIRAIATQARVTVTLGTSYLRYQLANRSPLPVGRGRIPKPWSEKVRSEALRAFRDILGGK